MTRTIPELHPLAKVPHHTILKAFDPGGFNAHQTRLIGGYSVESGFEPGILPPRGSNFFMTHQPDGRKVNIHSILKCIPWKGTMKSNPGGVCQTVVDSNSAFIPKIDSLGIRKLISRRRFSVSSLYLLSHSRHVKRSLRNRLFCCTVVFCRCLLQQLDLSEMRR
ncbi:hypothetical protein AVEN_202029-1 [Araneus ventricosus]|uniref:Uncharacterized protein n=1 Tax=Araneus ventricosus TaxID=182803 RepID=A0A4Y2R0J3_ARAVE|nr:hypothetical protein AVEN_202029-1 [Araneus ventricosus]